MDFHQSQETLTILEWILRSLVGFSFLLIMARVLGQRAISQLRILDFVIALVVGDIIAHPLSDQQLALKGPIVTTIVLVVLYSGGIFLTLKWPRFRKLLNSGPITIIEDGKIFYKGLQKARISLDILLEELRVAKVEDVQKVALALWEANGKISIFLDPKYNPLTPAACQMESETFELPRTIIKDGKINAKELDLVHRDEGWVISKLRSVYHTDVANVLLATLDSKDNLNVIFYR